MHHIPGVMHIFNDKILKHLINSFIHIVFFSKPQGACQSVCVCGGGSGVHVAMLYSYCI